MLNGMLNNLSAIGGEALDSLLRPMAQAFGDLLFYALISDFIRNEIDNFGFQLLERVSSLVGVAALSLVTIWVLFQGFRIISGQSRDSMMAFVLSVARVALIVTAATSLGVTSGELHEFISEKLPNSITATVTGDEGGTIEEQIDGNLAAMQFAMSSIDAINIVQDPTLNDDKKRALAMVAVGTAGPAMIGGAMLLLYKVALALFVGLGPIFILCLIFDQTKSFFSRWLMYGISTMFSLAVLSAMIAISTKLVLGVAGAFWTTTTLSALTGISLTNGMTTIALQQGGVGLLLTVLIVTTPPMAAQFFNGAIGSASAFSQVGQGRGDWRSGDSGAAMSNAGRPGANPGETGYRGESGANANQSGSGTQTGGLPQAARAGYNNPATNPNYGNASPAQPSGLRGAASPENASTNTNLNSPANTSSISNPNTSPPIRDRGEA